MLVSSSLASGQIENSIAPGSSRSRTVAMAPSSAALPLGNRVAETGEAAGSLLLCLRW